MITKYENLGLDELIRVAEDRFASPLIEELVKRLQDQISEPPVIDRSCECPVCEAQLRVKVDDANETITLQSLR